MRRHRVIQLILAALAVSACVVVVMLWSRGGIKVSVTNMGQGTVRQVRIDYAGGTAFVGDLAPSASGYARVHPTGDSHLTILFVDEIGERRVVTADVFVDAHVRGSIRLSLRGQVCKIEESDLRIK